MEDQQIAKINSLVKATDNPILICTDRDGTINKDNNYYLGSSPNWEKQIEFLPGVIEGIKLINKIEKSKIVIVTNQSGVALGGERFEQLTEKRLEEVNNEIVKRAYNQYARISDWFSCPYVDMAYAKKAQEKGRIILTEYVQHNHPDMKPNIGMIEKAAQKYGKSLDELKFKYMIGDRASDFEMGLKAGCTSILINSPKTEELGDFNKVINIRAEHKGKVYVATDFYQAAELILANLYCSLTKNE